MIIHLNHLFSRSRLFIFLFFFTFSSFLFFSFLFREMFSKMFVKLSSSGSQYYLNLHRTKQFPQHRFAFLFPLTTQLDDASLLPPIILNGFVNFLLYIWIHFFKENWNLCSQNSPIVFGSIWYAGMPQCAGGGVVRWSPLWQKNGVNPILFACERKKKKNKRFS